MCSIFLSWKSGDVTIVIDGDVWVTLLPADLVRCRVSEVLKEDQQRCILFRSVTPYTELHWSPRLWRNQLRGDTNIREDRT